MHNWLGHIALGKFGGRRRPTAALAHFEQAARAGHGEAAFNAGLMHDEGTGVPPSEDRACDFYRRGVELGHVPSMTNLAAKIIEHDFGAAADLCERAAEAGDGKAAALLQALTEAGMAVAVEDGLAPDEDGDVPPPVRVASSGTGRPQAIAAALREGLQAHARRRKGSPTTCLISAAGASWCGRRRRAGRTRRTRSAAPKRSTAAGPTRSTCWRCAWTWGLVAAGIAVEVLKPTAKAPAPALDPATLARMQAASYLHADAQAGEDLDEEDDEGWISDNDGDFTNAADTLADMLGAGPEGDPMGLMDSLRCAHPIQPEVWLGTMEEHLGWAFSDVDEDAELDGAQIPVAVGSGRRRLSVIMSAVTYIPGDLRDQHVARLKAHIGAAYPAGAVLMFNRPVGWPPEQGLGGLLYGGLLWWNKA